MKFIDEARIAIAGGNGGNGGTGGPVSVILAPGGSASTTGTGAAITTQSFGGQGGQGGQGGGDASGGSAGAGADGGSVLAALTTAVADRHADAREDQRHHEDAEGDPLAPAHDGDEVFESGWG